MREVGFAIDPWAWAAGATATEVSIAPTTPKKVARAVIPRRLLCKDFMSRLLIWAWVTVTLNCCFERKRPQQTELLDEVEDFKDRQIHGDNHSAHWRVFLLRPVLMDPMLSNQ